MPISLGSLGGLGNFIGGGTLGSQTASMALATGAGPAALSFYGGERANEANKDMARENMRWQEGLSNTSYRRAMADLEAAGLNPLLVGKLGGASTPGVNMPYIADTITPAVNTSMQSYDVATRRNQMQSNVALQSSQQKNVDVNTEKARAEIPKIAAEVRLIDTKNKLTDAQVTQVAMTYYVIHENARNLQQRTKGLSLDNAMKRVLSDFYTSNEAVYIAKDMGLDLRTMSNLIGGVAGKFLGRANISKTFDSSRNTFKTFNR